MTEFYGSISPLVQDYRSQSFFYLCKGVDDFISLYGTRRLLLHTHTSKRPFRSKSSFRSHQDTKAFIHCATAAVNLYTVL